MNFAAAVGDRVKIKETEKMGTYLHPARELKKLWNIRVMIILIVVSTLETVSNCLKRRLEEWEITGKIETIQPTSLRSVRILKRIQETREDLL